MTNDPPAIALSNVSFSYRDGTAALNNFSATIGAGECVALVGPNGAGKTTLTLLLAGFLEAATGTVSLHGQPLTRDNAATLRAKTGFLFHDPDDQLFMPTLLEDVCFGLRNAGIPAAFGTRRLRFEAEQGFIAPPEYGQAQAIPTPFVFRMTA